MPKGLIAFIVVACMGLISIVIIFMIESAGNARKISDDIMEEFKKVDGDLQESNKRYDSLNNQLFDSLKIKLK